MSNQNATHNRVTLLESIEAARRSVIVAMEFHRTLLQQRLCSNERAILLNMSYAETELYRAAVIAAQLEAWGDGP